MTDTRVKLADPLCTISDAENLLCCERSTVFRLLRKGKLTRVKVGSATRIPLSSIEAYISANTEQAS
jgi:excisionase family DNA binding protein